VQTLLKDAYTTSVAIPPEYQEIEKSVLMKKGGVLKMLEVECEAESVKISANH